MWSQNMHVEQRNLVKTFPAIELLTHDLDDPTNNFKKSQNMQMPAVVLVPVLDAPESS